MRTCNFRWKVLDNTCDFFVLFSIKLLNFLISISKLELTFAEILSISHEENDDTNIDDLIINTVQKEDFVFKCYEAIEVVELMTLILKTMKKNSIYAVVVQVTIDF